MHRTTRTKPKKIVYKLLPCLDCKSNSFTSRISHQTVLLPTKWELNAVYVTRNYTQVSLTVSELWCIVWFISHWV